MTRGAALAPHTDFDAPYPRRRALDMVERKVAVIVGCQDVVCDYVFRQFGSANPKVLDEESLIVLKQEMHTLQLPHGTG